jgi:hypothetical protein
MSTSPGDVHDVALKAAETDAAKQGLAAFARSVDSTPKVD